MARKKKHPEHENLERWLVSYADFITLLFAFFTVLYALSMTDKAKYKNAVENIQRAFQSAGGIFPLRGSPFTPFEKAPDRGSKVPVSHAEQGPFSKESSYDTERTAEQIRALFERTTGLGVTKGDVDVIRTDGGYKIRLGETMLFKSGSDKLRREHLPFLYEVGKRLARLGAPVQIEGHSDRMDQDTEDKHWQLSLNRSYHVVRFLTEGAEFPKDRISLTAFGDAQPVADNDTEAGRSRNRRVEISILAPDRAIQNIDW